MWICVYLLVLCKFFATKTPLGTAYTVRNCTTVHCTRAASSVLELCLSVGFNLT